MKIMMVGAARAAAGICWPGAPPNLILVEWVFLSVRAKTPLKRPRPGRLNGAPDLSIFQFGEVVAWATPPSSD